MECSGASNHCRVHAVTTCCESQACCHSGGESAVLDGAQNSGGTPHPAQLTRPGRVPHLANATARPAPLIHITIRHTHTRAYMQLRCAHATAGSHVHSTHMFFWPAKISRFFSPKRCRKPSACCPVRCSVAVARPEHPEGASLLPWLSIETFRAN